MPEGLELAREYHHNLPQHIRAYLRRARGISDEAIDHRLLGWNGSRITIPIFDREGNLTSFKLAKDPEDKTDSPKMLATPGAHAELYDCQTWWPRPEQIIICEGEFDRLMLESRGFAAVTSTGGAATFRPEWVEAFSDIPTIYMCFDNDAAGRAGAERVAQLIPRARIVQLPAEVGESGDVTDFLVRLGRSRQELPARGGPTAPAGRAGAASAIRCLSSGPSLRRHRRARFYHFAQDFQRRNVRKQISSTYAPVAGPPPLSGLQCFARAL
jgi:hypothetical protein